MSPRPLQFTKNELLSKLLDLRDELGYSPSVNDINHRDDYPSAQTYKKYFGSWNDAKEAAGLKTTEYSFGPDDRVDKRLIPRKRKEQEECCECGFEKTASLTFHHPENVDKVASIANMVNSGYSRNEIRKEMDKCILVCQNCHARHHADYDQFTVDE